MISSYFFPGAGGPWTPLFAADGFAIDDEGGSDSVDLPASAGASSAGASFAGVGPGDSLVTTPSARRDRQ